MIDEKNEAEKNDDGSTEAVPDEARLLARGSCTPFVFGFLALLGRDVGLGRGGGLDAGNFFV